jgi:hypothetical protein
MLPLEREPDTRIVIVDDDWLCNPDLLEDLERRFVQTERTAIGLSGARLPRRWRHMDTRIGAEIRTRPPLPWRLTFLAEPPEDVPVDLLQFGFGTIVRRDWLDDDVFELAGRDAPWRFADDVMLSGYLASKEIRRLCVAGTPLPRLLDHAKVRPLSGDGRMTARYRTAITALASALGIWPRHELAPSFPSRPSLAELRYWSGLALRKAGRFLSAASGRRA